ncbi:SUF system Fe-S cluster assembly protein [Haliangium ochraceum]|uniref:FeS assembly SUF system protein n=1 Tax=Haliangium ochraceum (strain DSM 14365 / JCM 11303 / SMP-2) TaxID=502025 RepID=D0LTT7_HALO1|nr:SUF system Fe-S cluster assembly protein [Haliangium ochraceum]ACY15781.1 FeS assembly SUF system protein [Haliangium ochraceum DSM 14365]
MSPPQDDRPNDSRKDARVRLPMAAPHAATAKPAAATAATGDPAASAPATSDPAASAPAAEPGADFVAVASSDKPAPGPDDAPLDLEALRDGIVGACKSVFDPEIPVDIYELGLIYAIDIADTGEAALQMTLTAPGCPVAGTLPQEVADRVAAVDGVREARVTLVWDPPWSMERMSEEAKLELGFF